MPARSTMACCVIGCENLTASSISRKRKRSGSALSGIGSSRSSNCLVMMSGKGRRAWLSNISNSNRSLCEVRTKEVSKLPRQPSIASWNLASVMLTYIPIGPIGLAEKRCAFASMSCTHFASGFPLSSSVSRCSGPLACESALCWLCRVFRPRVKMSSCPRSSAARVGNDECSLKSCSSADSSCLSSSATCACFSFSAKRRASRFFSASSWRFSKDSCCCLARARSDLDSSRSLSARDSASSDFILAELRALSAAACSSLSVLICAMMLLTWLPTLDVRASASVCAASAAPAASRLRCSLDSAWA
mmetsp:Transcript_24733/g.62591  ORF Transcript_24733/g.62591 Transcript_24733/m.62591 type:complete len:305 (+) Transcript_24733:1709-2623(+)